MTALNLAGSKYPYIMVTSVNSKQTEHLFLIFSDMHSKVICVKTQYAPACFPLVKSSIFAEKIPLLLKSYTCIHTLMYI